MKKDKREEFYLRKEILAITLYRMKKFNEKLIASYKKYEGRYWDGLVDSLIDTNRNIKITLKVKLFKGER